MITSFVAVAELREKIGKNTFLTFWSKETFVNVGVHQEVWLEVNTDYARQNKIPIVRRDIGGGTVIITPDEHDYWIIVSRNEAPSNPKDLYEKYLTPVVHALKKLGLNARLRDQDIVVNDRKISGNGAMTHGNSVVIAGNILLRLNVDLMAKLLKVPSEKFRDKVKKEMSEWLTSLERELGYVPSRDEINDLLKNSFEEVLGIKLVEDKLTEEEVELWEKLAKEKMEESWIYYKDNRHPELHYERCVKISSNVAICHVDYKARKLLRITAKFIKNKLDEVSISGDFFIMNPKDFIEYLEDSLRGVKIDEINKTIDSVFNEKKPIIFGFDKEDLKKAFEEIIQKPEVQEVILQ